MIRRYTNTDGRAYGWILLDYIQLHCEPPGVISEKPGWIVFHAGYMYGPYDRWYQAIKAFVFEYKDDAHLVG